MLLKKLNANGFKQKVLDWHYSLVSLSFVSVFEEIRTGYSDFTVLF